MNHYYLEETIDLPVEESVEFLDHNSILFDYDIKENNNVNITISFCYYMISYLDIITGHLIPLFD